jgi:hypothetical protein
LISSDEGKNENFLQGKNCFVFFQHWIFYIVRFDLAAFVRWWPFNSSCEKFTFCVAYFFGLGLWSFNQASIGLCNSFTWRPCRYWRYMENILDFFEMEVTKNQARLEVELHAVSWKDFLLEVGEKEFYSGEEVLGWLGY